MSEPLAFKDYSETELDALVTAIASFQALFSDEFGLPIYLTWGTLLAIYRDVVADGQSDSRTSRERAGFKVEVRWLYRIEDLRPGTQVQPKYVNRSAALRLEMVFETDLVEGKSYEIKSLLGPVNLVCFTHENSRSNE
ncbi:MAG: hypothetical protein AAF384_06645, partial [Pseudomonadota bacterium]